MKCDILLAIDFHLIEKWILKILRVPDKENKLARVHL